MNVMKFYDMYTYYVTDIEIYNDSFYSRRMIYPRKNEEFTFDGLMELADSIKKNGYITSIKYHSDDLKMTMQIFVDRGRDPIDIIGKFEDLVAEYDIKIDMSDKGIREIKDTFSDYCEL